MSRATSARNVAFVGGGGLVGASAGFLGLLAAQARLARHLIGEPVDEVLSPDGVYEPFGVHSVFISNLDDVSASTGCLRMALLGDSSAAGLGVETVEQTPGALLASGLAEGAGRCVRLKSTATVGARSRDLDQQIDEILANGVPDVAVIYIGANDVTHRVTPRDSVRHLTQAMMRLRELGVGVVVATCPDLGTIRPIPHPLRLICRRWSRALAQAQDDATTSTGGHPVPLHALLGAEFEGEPHLFFGPDRFHPSAHGYAASARAVLPAVYAALGIGLSTPSQPLA